MSKLLTIWSIIFFLPFHASAQDNSREMKQLKRAIALVGYEEFVSLKESRQRCVRNDVGDTTFKTLLTGFFATSLGEGLALKQLINKVLLSGVPDKEALTRIQSYLTHDQYIKNLQPSVRARILKKGWIVAAAAAVAEVGYYLATGNDLLTRENVNLAYRYLTGKNSDNALSHHYMTKEGFGEFLNLNSKEEVMRMFELNPKLVIAVIAGNKFVTGLSCEALTGYRPEELMPENPLKPSLSPTIEKPAGDNL